MDEISEEEEDNHVDIFADYDPIAFEDMANTELGFAEAGKVDND